MAGHADFRILVATDGSTQARAAIAAVVEGPWPDRTRVRAIVARRIRVPHRRSILLSALDRTADDAADSARGALAARWPGAEAVVVDQSPVKGVLGEAAKFRADLIVIGSHGRRGIERLVLGSVTQKVLSVARVPVLVVRE